MTVETITRGVARAYLSRLTACLARVDPVEIDAAIELIRTTWLAGQQIITLGNGGSAITALHFTTDWTKSVYLATGRQFRGRSLIDNIGLVTAHGNDASYADIFSEQIKAIATSGDLVVAISGSGNSENVVRAVETANALGCQTLGLCGFTGGRLREKAKQVIWIDVQDMQLAEDAHAMFGHMVMKALCQPEWPASSEF